jgi:hypothetical protein
MISNKQCEKSLLYTPNFAGEFDSVSLFEEQGLVALHIPKNSQFRGYSKNGKILSNLKENILKYSEVQHAVYTVQ